MVRAFPWHTMMMAVLVVLAGWLFAAADLPAEAAGLEQGWVAGANSRARLNFCPPEPDRASQPLRPLAFLELQLDDGWKTYWRMPGDAGVAPAFDWSGSANVASATTLYPAPHRMGDQGGEAIGYKSAVIFPVRLELREAALVATPKVIFSYGICKNICVPVDLTLEAACYGASAATAAAVDAVPRTPGHSRPGDPILVAVSGSVAGAQPRLTVDVDYGVGAEDADLFIEAPEGLYVPLPARSAPDATGRARYIIDLSKIIDARDLGGKQLRLTMTSARGASEAVWAAR